MKDEWIGVTKKVPCSTIRCRRSPWKLFRKEEEKWGDGKEEAVGLAANDPAANTYSPALTSKGWTSSELIQIEAMSKI